MVLRILEYKVNSFFNLELTANIYLNEVVARMPEKITACGQINANYSRYTQSELFFQVKTLNGIDNCR